jgi:hypothetical protein
VYGAKLKYNETYTSSALDAGGKLYIQEVVGVLSYYAGVIDYNMLTQLN